MASLASFNIDLEEMLPQRGPLGLNSCGNPDCRSFGTELVVIPKRLPPKGRRATRCPTADALEIFQTHRPGAYALTGSRKKEDARKCTAFGYETAPYVWGDNRTVKCRTALRNGTICDTRFQLLSEDHVWAEADRLRNMNGVLDGPSCGACGRRYLEAPEEFSLNGAHQRKSGKPGAAPKSVRVIHRPCKGKRGARFTVSVPHARQKTTKDNLRILHALVNSAGINDVRRILGSDSTDKSIGVSRIYDRIAWLEQVFLAYEREMLRRWSEKQSKSRKKVVHRLSHDDLVLSVNWEASSAKAITSLNCAVTADVDSGYVYRIDVDFDPAVSPMEVFRTNYLDPDGMPANLGWSPERANGAQVPLFAWQRPTGRFHEPQFFAACENELKAFAGKVRRSIHKKDPQLKPILDRVQEDIEKVRCVGQDWFGFKVDTERSGGSFRGMTTRDTYTKAAHFVLLKEMLPEGEIVLTTEQEAILARVLPHVFEDEIRNGRFTWLTIGFNKKAKKTEILSKVKTYRDAWKKFYDEGLYDGRFTLDQDLRDVTLAYIADNMTAAVKPHGNGVRPYPGSNFSQGFMPALWVRSPTQASGEIDKVVGFPLVKAWTRLELKELPFDTDVQKLDSDFRAELAELVYQATMQPVSSAMNAIRERIGATLRAGGGARTSGSYIQGAAFNPKVLISLLNIFRVHYNFFEMRPYVTLDNAAAETSSTGRSRRSLRFPGTDDLIELPPIGRSKPRKRTPAMRHGIDAVVRKKDGTIAVPNLYRVLYRPWLYVRTPVGRKFERPGRKAPPPVRQL